MSIRGRVGALLAVLALVVTACGDEPAASTVATTAPTTTTTFGGTTTSAAAAGSSAPATTQASDARHGGTLRWHAPINPPLNPFLAPTEPESGSSGLGWYRSVWPALFGGVGRTDGATGEAVPNLVVEFPTIENGGLTINADGSLTVHYDIDPAAVWSDGVPISGDDFAFTYEYIVGLEALLTEATLDGGSDAELFTVCDEATALIGPDLSVAGIDPGSLRSGPKWFEYTLTSGQGSWYFLFDTIVPKHAVEGSNYLTDWIDRIWPSAGAFAVASFDRDSRELVLERNPNYWRTDPGTGRALPYLDRIEITSPADEVAPLLSEEFREAYLVADAACGRDAVLAALDADPATAEGGAIFGAFQEANVAAALELFDRGVFVDLAQGVAFGAAEGVLNEVAGRIEQGDVVAVGGRQWAHVGFNYGDTRLRRNPNSLIEHVDFRRAIAFAIDRDRIAAEAAPVATEAMASIVDSYSPSLAGEGWSRYPHDPDEARRLIGVLCADLGRDCEADPPRLAFTESIVRPQESGAIARLLTEMLAEVGIEVDVTVENLFDVPGCPGWEAIDFSWFGAEHWAGVAEIFAVLDPAASPFFFNPGPSNLYQWGTEAFASEGFEDDPATPDCDEATVYDTGPSSVRDEFTQRYEQLLRRREDIVDPVELVPLVHELDEILADQVVLIPLYLMKFVTAVRTDIVAAYADLSFDTAPFWNVDRWSLKQPQPGT